MKVYSLFLSIIVFLIIAACNNSDFNIYLYNRGSARLNKLTDLNSSSADLNGAISANGCFIAFTSNRPEGVGKFDIYLYDLNKKAIIDLLNLNSKYNDFYPSINENGNLIVFTSDRPFKGNK